MKNLFVVYPGGCGGNHLVNMLLLCPGFNTRFTFERFLARYEHLDKGYQLRENNGIVSHFSDACWVDFLEQKAGLKEEILNRPKEKINLFFGHHHCYAQKTNFLEDFEDRKWIVLDFPKIDSLPHKRLMKSGYIQGMPEAYTWPYNTNSTPNYQANDDNGILIETEKYFTSEGSQYLREKIIRFNLQLPSEADILHSMWYKWMQYVSDER